MTPESKTSFFQAAGISSSGILVCCSEPEPHAQDRNPPPFICTIRRLLQCCVLGADML